VAIDARTYWRIGGYRAAAGESHPLALLRTVRRASGRVAVADGRRVIPPAKQVVPVGNGVGVGAGVGNGLGVGVGIGVGEGAGRASVGVGAANGHRSKGGNAEVGNRVGGLTAGGGAEATRGGTQSGESILRGSLSETARRVLSALVGTRP
jgi:hypothetical protein